MGKTAFQQKLTLEVFKSTRYEDADDRTVTLSRDENDPNGLVVAQTVEEVFVRHGLIWHLHVGGQVIRTTAEHPFFVSGRGWTPCHELTIGDTLLTEDGTFVPVEDLLDTGEWQPVSNPIMHSTPSWTKVNSS